MIFITPSSGLEPEFQEPESCVLSIAPQSVQKSIGCCCINGLCLFDCFPLHVIPKNNDTETFSLLQIGFASDGIGLELLVLGYPVSL